MNLTKRVQVECDEDWIDWAQLIPTIKFESDWEVKIIPPYGGAMARFLVFFSGARVSVYLDCNEVLGIEGEPYWEIYPIDKDVQRVKMADTEKLISMIKMSISDQIEQKKNNLVVFNGG